MSSEVRTGRHVVFNLHAHLVFVTKYRRKVLNKNILDDMKRIFEKITNEHQVILKEFNGEEDHVHMLIHYPPKVSIAKLVNSLKGVSSRRLRQNWPELEKRYYKGVLWSPSYFAGSCGGAPVEIVRKYIEAQNSPG
ncbi:MAG: IS200/IS605 family transposase [Myxococcales bacterium]|nr:IS200/IS605 family transposase [Myxococcales bacterium]USN50800.1 MAG: IS200/IS605 family transposase [Myxococcales bacterium]